MKNVVGTAGAPAGSADSGPLETADGVIMGLVVLDDGLVADNSVMITGCAEYEILEMIGLDCGSVSISLFKPLKSKRLVGAYSLGSMGVEMS